MSDDDSVLIALLEELTGFQAFEKHRTHAVSFFEIFEKHELVDPKSSIPYAVVKFYDGSMIFMLDSDRQGVSHGHDSSMENYYFNLADKDWIDDFNEFWDEEIEKIHVRQKYLINKRIRKGR